MEVLMCHSRRALVITLLKFETLKSKVIINPIVLVRDNEHFRDKKFVDSRIEGKPVAKWCQILYKNKNS